jgi:hypothetical protein
VLRNKDRGERLHKRQMAAHTNTYREDTYR